MVRSCTVGVTFVPLKTRFVENRGADYGMNRVRVVIMKKTGFLVALVALPLLGGCDAFSDLLGIPDPAREAAAAVADGEAIGSACRQSGRSIEDCYTMNPEAQKAAVFNGWRSMNDYMMERNLKETPSQLPPPAPKSATPEVAPTRIPPPPAAPVGTNVAPPP